MQEVEIKHFHFFAGLGGGARGFNRGRAELKGMRARFRCIGGIDSSAAAIRDFNRMAGVPGTVMDLFDREQYTAFHGTEPPAGWREATPADIRAAAGNERPNIVFLSAPCKGFSGLLSETRSKTQKYQALNRLTLRGIFLMCEAWADNLPELIIFENVPRIASRGRKLLDQIGQILRHYGYAVAETFHDCGELGELAQSRKRFLLVARHIEKVRPFLYTPTKRPLRAVGDVLSKFPMPGDLRGGPMHSLPNLQWKTWVRLAFVEAGSDWRSLNKLKVVDGKLAEYALAPEGWFGDTLGVIPWNGTSGVVTGMASPTRGAFSVADPRAMSGYMGKGKYRVTAFDEPTNTIIGQSTTGHGSFAVADPRLTIQRERGDHYLTNGHYGVLGWDQTSGAVSAAASQDNGRWSVADPRLDALPDANQNCAVYIRAIDGTWHRPFTTLELAGLQSLIDPDDIFDLDGDADGAKRERIGNAVPPLAAQAIADLMGDTLLRAWTGESFSLSSLPIWVQPVAVALSVKPAANLENPCIKTSFAA